MTSYRDFTARLKLLISKHPDLSESALQKIKEDIKLLKSAAGL